MPIVTALVGFFFLSGALSVAPASVSAPAIHLRTVTLTGYNAVPEQTDSDPLITASGVYSNPEIIAARSQDLAKELPFGTIIEIGNPTAQQNKNNCGYEFVKPKIGYRIIADSMNARYSNYVDILFNTKSNFTMSDGSIKNASTILGICDSVPIRVVGFIDLSHSNHLPKTQSELAAIIRGEIPLALK